MAAALLVLGVSGSLSGFTAAITNNTNTATAGALVMTETGLSGVVNTDTCTSPDATCDLNKFGGQTAMVPDTTTLTGTTGSGTIPADGDADQNIGIVKLTNTGTVTASTLTVAGSPCTTISGTGTSLCSLLDVAVYASATAPTSGTQTSYGTQVFYGSATDLSATASSALTVASSVAANASEYLTFVVWIDSSATNADQGLTASEPITWTFNQ